MDLGIKGKKALVCASSKGLGLAVAMKLFAEGCELLICARNQSELEAAAADIACGANHRPHVLAVDLSQPAGIETFALKASKLLGGIDILVNNVGGPPPSTAESTNFDAWHRGFEQLFLSSALLSQAVLPGMKTKGWGRIMTITSLSVFEPIDNLVVSTAMRTAVTAFMKTLSKEVAPFGVTVNTVLPGVIHTDRIVQLRHAKAERDGTTLGIEMEKTSKTIPMRRLVA